MSEPTTRLLRWKTAGASRDRRVFLSRLLPTFIKDDAKSCPCTGSRTSRQAQPRMAERGLHGESSALHGRRQNTDDPYAPAPDALALNAWHPRYSFPAGNGYFFAAAAGLPAGAFSDAFGGATTGFFSTGVSSGLVASGRTSSVSGSRSGRCVTSPPKKSAIAARFPDSPPCARGRRPRLSARPTTVPVHPRVQGEDVHRQGPGTIQPRFTPVCTGKTCRGASGRSFIRFTPVCTGKTRCRPIGLLEPRRFTPVCTGKTSRSPGGSSRPAVHPRVHGEDPFGTRKSWHGEPVHPRVHGEDEAARLTFRVGRRFTPVCTGKTAPRSSSRISRSVHARVHGEDGPCVHLPRHVPGSPPCARGRLFHRDGRAPAPRFTPVCTGKTQLSPDGGHNQAVHPRVHGEDDRVTGKTEGVDGSPPCARGRRRTSLPQRPLVAVHPRVHGEDFCLHVGYTAVYGSPPCARGRPTAPPPA